MSHEETESFRRNGKKAGAKAAVSTANKASVFYCYQPKEPKGLDKFNK